MSRLTQLVARIARWTLGIIFGTFFFLLLIGYLAGGSTEEVTGNEAGQEASTPEGPVSLADHVRLAVDEGLGDAPRELDLVQHSTGFYEVRVRFEMGDNFTSNLRRIGLLTDVMDAVEALSATPRLDSVRTYTFTPHFPLVDEYGNESLEPVGTLQMHRETADRINWQNMNHERFRGLLQREGTFQLHPAMY